MVFVKVQKSKAYFKRFQVKFARRRACKTDYQQRRTLIVQDKNKYSTPKFRFAVRFTNTTVICQIIKATLDHDEVFVSAYSSELPRYGMSVGLKNYSAAYCTGLLCARRCLEKLGMAEIYQGTTEVNGVVNTTSSYSEMGKEKTHFIAGEVDEERRPFRALLDVGLKPTTTGSRSFGALKGAVDGGLDIPHSEKRFPGYDRKAKKYNSEAHRARIFGDHVADYMEELQKEEPEKYAAQFSQYIKAGLNFENLEEAYEKTHEAIRANPARVAKKERTFDKKYKNVSRRTLAQRKARVSQIKANMARAQ
eukprot:TRINITY_DN50853_c0_g1_i1.p1 TRINITY_DN50853_c0_g1~~TRINITY_DN50853_c0_g1_i1.p1  ORF type:complete len:316 (+),score=55.35 TRINITY_DN50853_c0_g1_i1:29-949(+)